MAAQSLTQALHDDPDRFVRLAFDENSDISDFSEFQEALFSAFDSDRGSHATKWFNDDETIFLFNSTYCRERLREKLSEEEFNEIYGQLGRGELSVEREVPKGQYINPEQVHTVRTPKEIQVYPKGGLKSGKTSYFKGQMKWTKSQKMFVRTRVAKGKTPKQITTEYNEHFEKMPRTEASISARIEKDKSKKTYSK